mgnify:CR=1 FL=1
MSHAKSDLCTVQLARRVAPALEGHNLDALADHFGIEIKGAIALPVTRGRLPSVLLQLLDELEIRGVQTLGDARNFKLTGTYRRRSRMG